MEKLDHILSRTPNPTKRSSPATEPSSQDEKQDAPRSLRPEIAVGDSDCPHCRGTGFLRYDVPFGHEHFGELAPCECRTAEIAEAHNARIENLRDQSSQLASDKQLTLVDIELRGAGSRAMVAACRELLVEGYGMLTLWGGAGNGKTLAQHAVVNSFVEDGRSAVYFTLSELLDYLRDGYDPDAGLKAAARYREIAAVDLLAVDEFDFTQYRTNWVGMAAPDHPFTKVRETPFMQEVVSNLVNDRYRLGREQPPARKYTVLAMNGDPKYLPAHIISRLAWGTQSRMNWVVTNSQTPDAFRIVHNEDPDGRPAGL